MRNVFTSRSILVLVFQICFQVLCLLYYDYSFGKSISAFAASISPKPTPPHSSTFETAAVASDAGPCSEVGRDILQRGGSVVDSAIAAMLCVGMINCQSVGIGGGFVMTIYNATTGKATFTNARDIAPAKAEQNMFKGNSNLSFAGSMTVGIPGQVGGFWAAHQKYGVIPWKDLFTPALRIIENGMEVSPALATVISEKEELVHNRSLGLWPIFENADGSAKVAGDIIHRPQLVKTLKVIADEGGDAFYKGKIADDIVKDLEDGFGDNVITKEDLFHAKPEIKDALNVAFNDLILFTPGPPAGGAVLAYILNLLKGYNITSADFENDENKLLAYHRIIEAFKFAYAKRSSLGDPRNNQKVTELAENMTEDWFADATRLKIDDARTFPVAHYKPDFVIDEDHGTSHMSILGPNGNAVAITSTEEHNTNILFSFGSKVIGKRTGIIFNSVMDDFSTPHMDNAYGVPPSPSNFIKPGNRPMSSMSPSIIVEASKPNKVKMVVGASGATKITTAITWVVINSLLLGHDVGTSVEMKRLHCQLMPNVTTFEEGFDQDVLDNLRRKGHNLVHAGIVPSVVQAILVNSDGTIGAASDSRKGGYPSGY